MYVCMCVCSVCMCVVCVASPLLNNMYNAGVNRDSKCSLN